MSLRRVCIDACVFIALEQPHKEKDPLIVEGCRSLMREIDEGRVFAVVSTAIFAELLCGSYDRMLPRMDGRKGELFDVNPTVAEKAREIRRTITNGTGMDPRDPKLEVPDCLYLATAVLTGCTDLVTIEGNGNRKKFKMLPLAERIQSAFGINVCLPGDIALQRTLIDVPVYEGD